MSSVAPPTSAIYRWQDGELELLDYCDMSETAIDAADSWFVSDGRTLAIALHRARFGGAIASTVRDDIELDVDGFWNAVLAAIPREGDWFPRVELQSRRGVPLLVFRQRSAPERNLSLTLATHRGADPRTQPTVKGPDLDAMLRLRTEAQRRGAGDAVILSPEGFVVEGTTTALLWWRGDALCAPADELERVDSVTAKTVLTLAGVLGIEVLHEAVTPDDLEGLELWALNALHGIRIVTAWIDGPQPAEEPGRLALWRNRLDRLARPMVTIDS